MTMQVEVLKFKDLPRHYAGLVGLFPLRPIHDAAELADATAMLDAMAMHHVDFSPDQADYFDVLSTLVSNYEAEHDPLVIPNSSPLEVLRSLLEGHGMTASDLGRVLGNRELGSKILRGERGLTVNHIRKLSRQFKLEAGVFVG